MHLLSFNRHVYERLLNTHVVPWIRTTYPNGNFVFQQDGAPAHGARSIQAMLTEALGGPDHFWRKEMWPPQSPDLNPLDYSIWSVMQQKVQATSHPNLETLKARIVEAWGDLEIDYVVRACKGFRSRIEAVIAADGSYIE